MGSSTQKTENRSLRVIAELVSGIPREIAEERVNQLDKWGEQNHFDIHPTYLYVQNKAYPVNGTGQHPLLATPSSCRRLCEEHKQAGWTNWLDILVEEVSEVAEAACTLDAVEARKELIQVAAVCVAWIEAIDRGGAA